jgi:hypothetical protein
MINKNVYPFFSNIALTDMQIQLFLIFIKNSLLILYVHRCCKLFILWRAENPGRLPGEICQPTQ